MKEASLRSQLQLTGRSLALWYRFPAAVVTFNYEGCKSVTDCGLGPSRPASSSPDYEGPCRAEQTQHRTSSAPVPTIFPSRPAAASMRPRLRVRSRGDERTVARRWR